MKFKNKEKNREYIYKNCELIHLLRIENTSQYSFTHENVFYILKISPLTNSAKGKKVGKEVF